MSTKVQQLAKLLTDKGPSASLRIGSITAIQAASGSKVQTDQTGTAWLNRSEDANLAVGDRVWMIQQGAVFLVAGRLSGEPSGLFVKQKTGTQSSVNTTLQDDTDLFVDLQPGLYRIELWAHASNTLAADTADIKSAWSNTGTMAANARACRGPGLVSVDTTASVTTAGSGIMHSTGHNLGTSIPYGVTDDGSSVITEDIPLVVTVAGRLQWQWAQNTTNATATTVSSASRIYVTPTQSL